MLCTVPLHFIKKKNGERSSYSCFNLILLCVFICIFVLFVCCIKKCTFSVSMCFIFSDEGLVNVLTVVVFSFTERVESSQKRQFVSTLEFYILRQKQQQTHTHTKKKISIWNKVTKMFPGRMSALQFISTLSCGSYEWQHQSRSEYIHVFITLITEQIS